MDRWSRPRIEKGLAALAVWALFACGTDSSNLGGNEAGATDDSAALGDGEESGADATASGAEGGGANGADAGVDSGVSVADGGVADASTEAGDASAVDAPSGDDGGGADARLDSAADAADALSGDDRSSDTSTEDAAAVDASATDAPSDAGCTLTTAPPISCGGVNNCNAATNYCVAGSVPNTCKPIPAECVCADTHDCACLLARIPSPCDGGIVTCTAYADGGQLWIFASNCH
jgi:hypothetical protein